MPFPHPRLSGAQVLPGPPPPPPTPFGAWHFVPGGGTFSRSGAGAISTPLDVVIDGGVGPYSYSWSTGSGASSISAGTVLANGESKNIVFFCTVTDLGDPSVAPGTGGVSLTFVSNAV